MLHVIVYYIIAILNIPDASSTISEPRGSQPQPCNSCCQGASGLPGIPGPSGHNGLPGRDGIKGERGEIGTPGLGDMGPLGPQGPSGERGESGDRGLHGLPGKVGPLGLKGTAGADGQMGSSGEKGELGQKGESGLLTRGKSAFTAIKTRSQTGSPNDVLTFDITESNIGNNFNLDTNRFTCQIPGIYWFTFTMARGSQQTPHVDLVKDGNIIVRTLATGSVFAQSTNGAVLQLAASEQVWIAFGSGGQQVYSDSGKYTTFSGFLLYED